MIILIYLHDLNNISILKFVLLSLLLLKQFPIKNPGSLPPNMCSRRGRFYMGDWLTIQCEKEKDSQWREFIERNPLLDETMRTLLGRHLKLNHSSLQHWIQDYKKFLNYKYQKG